jgi:hypothetical protein
MVARLLTAFALCTAGTAYAGILGAAGATGISVLTGIIANDLGSVWERVGKRIQGNEQILANNDLKKAVGMAIAAIIAKTAKDEDNMD